jgi:hypothetical protein
VENAARCTPLLRTCDSRRALVLSTPVVHANGELDNHPARALQDFREDRARGGHACRLAAVGCPFENGGPVWSEFE